MASADSTAGVVVAVGDVQSAPEWCVAGRRAARWRPLSPLRRWP